MSQGTELEFSMESRLDFNSKVSDEGDIGVVVEGTVGSIKISRKRCAWCQPHLFSALLVLLFKGNSLIENSTDFNIFFFYT